MNDGMKPCPLNAKFAEDGAETVCRAAGAEKVKSCFVYAFKFRNCAEQHCRSADEIDCHADDFELFVIKEKYFCNYSENSYNPADTKYGNPVGRADSVKSYKRAGGGGSR